MPELHSDKVLDARNLLCPMPIVKAAKEIRTIEPGQVLKILATDRGSIADFPAWSEDTGNELLEWHEENGVLIFYIRRSAED